MVRGGWEWGSGGRVRRGLPLWGGVLGGGGGRIGRVDGVPRAVSTVTSLPADGELRPAVTTWWLLRCRWLGSRATIGREGRMDCGGVVTDGMGVALLGGVCGWGRQDQESKRGGVVGGAVSSAAACPVRFPRHGSSGAVGLDRADRAPHSPPIKPPPPHRDGGGREARRCGKPLDPTPPPAPPPHPLPSPSSFSHRWCTARGGCRRMANPVDARSRGATHWPSWHRRRQRRHPCLRCSRSPRRLRLRCPSRRCRSRPCRCAGHPRRLHCERAPRPRQRAACRRPAASAGSSAAVVAATAMAAAGVRSSLGPGPR